LLLRISGHSCFSSEKTQFSWNFQGGKFWQCECWYIWCCRRSEHQRQRFYLLKLVSWLQTFGHNGCWGWAAVQWMVILRSALQRPLQTGSVPCFETIHYLPVVA
jgi:hypothetical protein